MSQIKLTPSFLIQLMQNSRGLNDHALMRVTDKIRQHEGLLTSEDISNLFLSEDKTKVKETPQSDSDFWAKNAPEHQEAVSNFLGDYLSSIDQNLTDQQVYGLYNSLMNMAEINQVVDPEAMSKYLEEFLKENASDVAALTGDELLEIIEQQELDEYETKSLIQQFPGYEHSNVFEDRVREKEQTPPLSLKDTVDIRP